jgi:hypothetical protein
VKPDRLNDADAQQAELWVLSNEIRERRLHENLEYLKPFFTDMDEHIMTWGYLI